jgi:hypothetical protein
MRRSKLFIFLELKCTFGPVTDRTDALGLKFLPAVQTLDLPAPQVTGIVEEIWRIARKASHGAT